ncbi:MAG: PAS domain-containing protein [Xanthomonadales bacterium]|nr:PAS domain-containing protein [Xanthomonadales bacterium]
MAYRRFSLRLAARLLLIAATTLATVWFVLQPGLHGLTLIAATVTVLLSSELWFYINRGNRELARFLDALRHGDFSQRFGLRGLGSGFDELGETLGGVLDQQQQQREQRETANRRLRALIEHIPVPLLTVHGDQSITLQNNAARRLFGAGKVVRLADLLRYGSGFHRAVLEAVPGHRELVTFTVEDIEYRLTMATTEIVIGGHAERLVSLQDIQTELDETQAQAWQDLVKVLTHEIMNSITPITSLATTAGDLVEDLRGRNDRGEPLGEDLEDLHDAVKTVARRSGSLVQFVDSYRQITRLAPPERRRIRLDEMFESAARLAGAEWPDSASRMQWSVEPPGLDVFADRDLLEPVLLNLLRNAMLATTDVDDAQIQMLGRLNRRGHVTIVVSDNGPGVPDELARKVFVPFFTTRKGGSGVGLALARQVMIAHKGFIRLDQNQHGGARFTLIF